MISNSLKVHITTVAIDLFTHKGIKRVSMDDVARKVNISKHTLYDFFADKEALLTEAINQLNESFFVHIDLLESKSYTALEIILLIHDRIIKKQEWICEDFFKDIMRYPKAYQVLLDGQYTFLNKIVELLKRGARESVFMSNINFDIISMIAHRHISEPGPPPTFDKYTNEEVQQTIMLIFLRGICTNEGRSMLDKFISKKKYEQYKST